MAKYAIEGTTLQGIADAIREKTGKTDSIPVRDYATEIGSISGGETETRVYAQYGGADIKDMPCNIGVIYGVTLEAGKNYYLEVDGDVVGNCVADYGNYEVWRVNGCHLDAIDGGEFYPPSGGTFSVYYIEGEIVPVVPVAQHCALIFPTSGEYSYDYGCFVGWGADALVLFGEGIAPDNNEVTLTLDGVGSRTLYVGEQGRTGFNFEGFNGEYVAASGNWYSVTVSFYLDGEYYSITSDSVYYP